MPGEIGDDGLQQLRNTWLYRWGVASWMLVGIILAIVLVAMAFFRAHAVLIPLVIAIIIGVLLEPFVSFQVNHHIPRWLAVVIT